MPSARSTVRMVSSLAKTAGWLAAVTAHQRLVADDEQYELFQRYMQRWSRVIIATAGAEVLLTPESVVPARHGARIIVANHRSPLDILILLGIFGGHALSRKDLAGWPIIGVAARRAGTIFVDRDSAQSGASAIREIRSRLKEGKSVLVFPEGGTFRGDEVRPFKAGIFTAMSGLSVEVVPVGVAYEPGMEWVGESFVAHVLRVAQKPVTRVVVHIGSPRTVNKRTGQLPDELRADVQQLVNGARDYWQRTSVGAVG
jgi:1-acyl-sn-glycerol-3-phosphate acyltransferase